MKRKEMMNRTEDLFEQLREIAMEMTPTKDDVVPDEENLAKDKRMNKEFDIDIFYSRRPGMRRSLQIISPGCTKKESIKLSCLTAMGSLLDTLIANKELNVTKEDVAQLLLYWLETHGAKIFAVKNK